MGAGYFLDGSEIPGRVLSWECGSEVLSWICHLDRRILLLRVGLFVLRLLVLFHSSGPSREREVENKRMREQKDGVGEGCSFSLSHCFAYVGELCDIHNLSNSWPLISYYDMRCSLGSSAFRKLVSLDFNYLVGTVPKFLK